MTKAETTKTLYRPIAGGLLIIGWIIMECLGVDVNLAYIALTVGANGEWVTERAVKSFKAKNG